MTTPIRSYIPAPSSSLESQWAEAEASRILKKANGNRVGWYFHPHCGPSDVYLYQPQVTGASEKGVSCYAWADDYSRLHTLLFLPERKLAVHNSIAYREYESRVISEAEYRDILTQLNPSDENRLEVRVSQELAEVLATDKGQFEGMDRWATDHNLPLDSGLPGLRRWCACQQVDNLYWGWQWLK